MPSVLIRILLCAASVFSVFLWLAVVEQNYHRDTETTEVAQKYAFQNPDLPIEQRIDNILSLMTIDEKIECLDTDPSVPRLGIKGSGHVEGIHGLTQGGPGKWGRPLTIPSTTFPQGIGLGETWDTDFHGLFYGLPSTTLRYFRSGGFVSLSTRPLGHLISMLSIFVAAPTPRTSRGSCEER